MKHIPRLFCVIALAYGMSANASAEVSYEIREFNPVGSGTLTVGGQAYPFRVAECHLQERELSSGWIEDAYVLGAGEANGRPYFIEARRSRDPRKKRRNSASISLNFTPLPAVYAHVMPTKPDVLRVLEQIRPVDALRSMGVGAVTYDGLSVNAGSVSTPEAVGFMKFTDGGFDGLAGKGTLRINCT